MTPPRTKPRVLVVDDHQPTSTIARAALEAAGYEVWECHSGHEALAAIKRRGIPHLALLDIMMPKLDGLELARKILEFCDLPIIMLTAVDDKKTVAKTIENLAEDYIQKPFDPAVVVARVGRLLQRIGDSSRAIEVRESVGSDLEICLVERFAVVNKKQVPLTSTEARLLYLLLRNRGRTVATNRLLARLWPNEDIFEDALRAHVYRLRMKVEPDHHNPRYLMTDRGVGYRLTVTNSGSGDEI